jgi:hypothetical protein
MNIQNFLSTLKLEIGDLLKHADEKLQRVTAELASASAAQRSTSLIQSLTDEYAKYVSTRDTYKACMSEIAEAQDLADAGSDRYEMARYLDPIELAVHMQSHAITYQAPQLCTNYILKALRYARRQSTESK